MASKKMNPALLAAATGLGNVSIWQASDTQDITIPLAEVQAKFVERRTRFRPELARIIAELCFARRAA